MPVKKVEFNCSQCGEVILRNPKPERANRFCGSACKALHQSVHWKGESNSNYKGGKFCSESYCSCGEVKDYRAVSCGTCTDKVSTFFSKGGVRRNATLWRYIKTFELIDYSKCLWCGLGWEWNGKPISLHLDHIDGDSSNNELTNLRVLCPNCHTQTPTYAAKNRSSK